MILLPVLMICFKNVCATTIQLPPSACQHGRTTNTHEPQQHWYNLFKFNTAPKTQHAAKQTPHMVSSLATYE